MSNQPPQNPSQVNLGILLREPFRGRHAQLHQRLADADIPTFARRTATCSSSSTAPAPA